MDMKRHMLISLFVSMLVSRERGEIIIRIKKSSEERNEIVIRIKGND